MFKIIKIIWWKWVKRWCPHVCIWCEYKDECWSNVLDDWGIDD